MNDKISSIIVEIEALEEQIDGLSLGPELSKLFRKIEVLEKQLWDLQREDGYNAIN
ncbi:hypothetical protein UFOVP760_277 [uncultured Caudovirales phage]|uniref:Uncharacterized protein n=1 Tax=uncultured Caudovirales phage TaxID=2100421 RepID=A0A6J7X6H3_9CAUD|nr:hypothetical protein UFOVP760_277 [uncultured Caudovirales phage]